MICNLNNVRADQPVDHLRYKNRIFEEFFIIRLCKKAYIKINQAAEC